MINYFLRISCMLTLEFQYNWKRLIRNSYSFSSWFVLLCACTLLMLGTPRNHSIIHPAIRSQVYICHVTCPCYLLLPSAPWVLHCMPPRYPLQSTLALFLYNAGRLILNTCYSVNSGCPSKLSSDPFKQNMF